MPVSFRKRMTFRPKPETRLDEFNFNGGLVTDAHETKLESNQSPNLANVVFNQTGSIKKRNGYARYGTGQNAQGSSSDQTNFGASTGSLALDDDTEYFAQTFQASGAISSLQVDLSLAMNTSGQTQRVRVELWSISGGVPSAILTTLAKSQVKLVSGTSETTYSFRFSTPIALSAATTYAVVLRPFLSGSSTTVNQVNVHHTGSAYANGSVFTSTDSGLNWTNDTAKDLKFTVYTAGNTGGTGLIRFYGTGGIKQLFTKIGTSLYRGNDVTGALSAITLGSGVSLVAANFIDWTIVNDTLLVVDNSNKIQKYRGSTNANYTTGTITATNGSTTVTGSSTVWGTATNAEVGEYIKLPDGKWYKITAIASNTSLTIELAYQGSTLSGQTYTISPWGEVQGKLNTSTAPASLVRPAPKYIENHINRVWTAESNTLRFSVLDTSVTEEHFNDWDTANNAGSLIVPAGKGDTITGLYSLNNSLYVFQRRAIWRLYGNSPANFELRNVTNEVGMLDKRTLVEWNDILVFLSDLGIIMFDGSNIKNVSDGVVNTQIDTWANRTSPAATLWGNTYLISYTPAGGSYNSEALILDLTRGIFGRMTKVYASVWSVWGGSTDTGEIYFVSSNQGSIYLWNSGTNDDGYEIEMLYDTPSLGLNQGVNTKTLKKFFVQAAASGDYDLTVTMYKDLSTSGDEASVSLSPGETALWDVGLWDTAEWSSEGDLITERIGTFQGDAKYLKWRFEQNGLDEEAEIFGLSSTQRIRRLV